MRGEAVDRAVIKALLELMQKENFKDITITEITEKAKVSRVTFYRHFNTVEDILIKYFQLTKERYKEQSKLQFIEGERNNDVAILQLFLFFKSNLSATKSLISAGLEGELLKFLNDEFENNLPVKLDKYLAYFVSGALYNVLIHWSENDCVDSIEEVSKPFREIQNFFNNSKQN